MKAERPASATASESRRWEAVAAILAVRFEFQLLNYQISKSLNPSILNPELDHNLDHRNRNSPLHLETAAAHGRL
jgi:hypothetical protein